MPPATVGLLACQCEGRSSLDEPRVAVDSAPSGPASTPPTVSPQAFADSYPEAFCDRYAGCCKRGEASRAQCLARQRDWLEERSKAPGLVFDASRAAGCLDGLRGWAGDYDLCLLAPREQFAGCTNVYSPDPAVRYPGESCEQNSQCEALYQSRCGLDASTGQRICQYNTAYDYSLGDPFFASCRTDVPGTQVTTLACELFNGRTCSEERNRCSFNHDAGGLCHGPSDCLPHLSCDQGLCVPAHVEGQSCPSGQASLCDSGLDCEDGVCAAIPHARLGEACLGVAQHCDEGTCVEGTCRPLDPDVAHECGRPPPS